MDTRDKAGQGGPRGGIPSRDDVVRDVIGIRDEAQTEADWWTYQLRRLRQALENRRGRFALLFAVANDPAEQRRITAELHAQLTDESFFQVVLDEDEKSILAALAAAPGAPAPLFVYGIERLLPSSDARRDRREHTLDELQYRRELFRGLGRPVILWMPDYAYTMIGQKAADFWSWQNGAFFFTSQSLSVEPERRIAPIPIDSDRKLGLERVIHVAELAAAEELLTKGRNVVLTGVGGSGKSMLARAAAERIRDRFLHGIRVVELKHLSGNGDAAEAALRQILTAVVDWFDGQGGIGALRAIYDDVFQGRQMLLVVDDVPDAETARLLIPPPPSQILMTSRAEIELAGLEQVRVGEISEMAAFEMVKTLLPELAPREAARIARLAEGSPLALRLLAGLVAGHGTEILEKLPQDTGGADFDPTRVNIASAAIARLSAGAKEILDALSIFRSDFDSAAAGAVAARPVEKPLAELVAAGLVTSLDSDRIQLHPLIADHVRTRLTPETRRSAEERHSDHYLQLLLFIDHAYRVEANDAGDAAPGYFRQEWPNIRQGQAWAASHSADSPEAALRTVGYALGGRELLATRLSTADRLAWFEAAAAAAQGLERDDLLAAILEELGSISHIVGDVARSDEYDRRAVQTYQEILATDTRDSEDELRALAALARIERRAGHLDRAKEYLSRMAATAETAQLPRFGAIASIELGNLAFESGELEVARQCYQRSLDMQSDAADPDLLGTVYHQLGVVARARSEWGLAEQWARRSLELAERVGNAGAMAAAYHELGILAQLQGNQGEAETLVRHALEVDERLGDRLGSTRALSTLVEIALARGDADAAEHLARRQIEQAQELGIKEILGKALYQLGQAAALRGNYEQALEHYRAALTVTDDHDQLAEILHFELSRVLMLMGQVSEAVEENLASIRLDLAHRRGDLAPNLGLLAHQRDILGKPEFERLMSASWLEESEDLRSLVESLETSSR